MTRLVLAAIVALVFGHPAARPALFLSPRFPGSPSADACGALRVSERVLVCRDGSVFRWRGVTAFRLVDQIADGREQDAVAYLDWASRSGFNVVRVLSTLCCWFDLPPDEGQRALPRLLELAGARGMYVQIVALAGTGPGERALDLEKQVRAIGAIAAAHPNAVVEIANEPYHPTQDRRLHDGALVDKLAALIPASVVTSSGAASDDASAAPPLGGLVTRHLARGEDKWAMVGRLRVLEEVSRRTQRPVLSGEPIGADEKVKPGERETDADVFFAYGALCRVFELSCNFHLEAGLHAVAPGKVQQAAAEAFIAGTRVVPDDWRLEFKETGSAGAPIAGFNQAHAVGVYCGVAGDDAVMVGLGLSDGPEIQWQGYTPRGLFADRGTVKVWHLRRVRLPGQL